MVRALRLKQPGQRLHRVQRQRQNARGHVPGPRRRADGVVDRFAHWAGWRRIARQDRLGQAADPEVLAKPPPEPAVRSVCRRAHGNIFCVYMAMTRLGEEALHRWLTARRRKPPVLRGARQYRSPFALRSIEVGSGPPERAARESRHLSSRHIGPPGAEADKSLRRRTCHGRSSCQRRLPTRPPGHARSLRRRTCHADSCVSADSQTRPSGRASGAASPGSGGRVAGAIVG